MVRTSAQKEGRILRASDGRNRRAVARDLAAKRTFRVFQYFAASAPGTITSGSLHRSSITKMTVSASFLDAHIIGSLENEWRKTNGGKSATAEDRRGTMIYSTVS
jgi:hypothetical protein